MSENGGPANPILKAARAYLLAGYNVLPVDGSKRAVVPWKELQERFPSDGELAAWWPDGHKLNVALLTGPISGGLAVLDIDDPGLAARMVDDPALVASTVAIRTPRGGLHLWVTESDGPSQSGPLVPGVADLKAAGGYVLAPPSRTADGAYRALSKGQPLKIDNALSWALRLLQEYGVPCREPEDNGAKPRLDVAAELANLTEGNRNETFARIAGKLRRGGWAAGEILGLLGLHAERVGFPVVELEAEVAGICSRYARNAGGTEATRFRPVPVSQLLETAAVSISWRWRDYIPVGGFTCIGGRSKVGKTTLAYHIAKAMSNGLPLLGRETTQGLVCIVALEEREEDVALRCRELGIDEGVTVHVGPLKSEAALEEIERWCREERPALIIFDTLFRFWAVRDAGDPMQVADALNPYLALARETGTSFLFLSQLRKSEGHEGMDILGSTELLAQMDVGLALRRRSEGQANERVLEAFSRYTCTPRELVIRLVDGEYEALGDRAELKRREQREKVHDALDNEFRGLAELSERVGLGARKTATVLNVLVAEGVAERTGRGVKGDPHLWRENSCFVPPLGVRGVRE